MHEPPRRSATLESTDESPVPAPAPGARRRRRRTSIVVPVIVVLALVAATLLVLRARSNHTTATACASGQGQTKAPLRGVLAVGRAVDTKSAADLAIGGWSLNVAWSALQTAPGGPLVHPNAIDNAIKQAQTASEGKRCALGIKLRVLTGTSSPGWAKQLGGPPVDMKLPVGGLSGTVPRFWSAQFGAAYADLQAKLAAAYDTQPAIRETVISRCTTFYAEPFNRQLSDADNLQALQAAGWTPQNDRQCLLDQVAEQRAWARTPSSLALNPYLLPAASSGSAKTSDKMALTVQVAQDCRKTLGQRCILANNSIRWPLLAGYQQLYQEMQKLGAPLEFQAAAPKRVGDVVATLNWAIGVGAGSVEIAPETLEHPPAGLSATASSWSTAS